MEVTIKGDAKEIAALVLAVQERQLLEIDPLRGFIHQREELKQRK